MSSQFICHTEEREREIISGWQIKKSERALLILALCYFEDNFPRGGAPGACGA